MKVDLAKSGEHAGGKPGSRHLRGVFSFGSFDKETADAGGYVVTLLERGPSGKPVEVERPIQSIGALRSTPGTFYFATDKRFAAYPGFACIWAAGTPADAPVAGTPGVNVAFAETVVNGQTVFRKQIDVKFQAGVLTEAPKLDPVPEALA